MSNTNNRRYKQENSHRAASNGTFTPLLADTPCQNLSGGKIGRQRPRAASAAMLSLGSFAGTLSATGDELQQHITRLSPKAAVAAPHITILSKNEVQKTGLDFGKPINIDQTSLQVLSLAEVKDVQFLTVSWPHAQLFRKRLGLPAKDFHVTLSKTDRHDIRKDVSTTMGGYPAFVKVFDELSEVQMDLFLADNNATIWHQDLCRVFLDRYPASYRALIRFADSVNDQPHHATNAYARALAVNPALHEYTTKKLKRLSAQAPCGPFQISGQEQLPAALLHPWPLDAKLAVRDILSECSTEKRVAIQYCGKDPTLPRFFSMPLPYRLATMSTPRNEQDIDALSSIGVTTVLTLTKEEPLDPAWFHYKTISNVYVPVPNYEAPSIAEMDYIFSLFAEDMDGMWCIHCGGGVGRAGTVTACLLAMHGSEDGTPSMDKTQAIAHIRHIRPSSIETTQQEDFIGSWLSHRWKIAHTAAPAIEEPYTSLTVETDPRAFPSGVTSGTIRFIMLVGLPGSGKSFLAQALAKRRADETIIVSQDESRSRSACEAAVSYERKNDSTLVILDRCNPEPADRKYWLSLLPASATSSSHRVCLFFDYSPELCLQRIDKRIGHPTIQAGRGRNALSQMAQLMEKPILSSSGFGAILTISSFNAAHEALYLLSGTIPITKFPRTGHLVNLGATTSDDLLQDNWSGNLEGHLVIEEKIDGANLGFSLSFERQLLVQNRSHYVNFTTHAQFKPLKTWLDQNSESLIRLLDRDRQFPERYILYGEWCAAKHSIPYSSLPSLFLAFDFYDRVTKTFASREYLTRLLSGTGISQVPLLLSTLSISREDLIAFCTSRTKSKFYDGPIEGVYVRFEDEKRTQTMRRGKIVRADFIAGDQHWTKGQLTLNGVSTSSSSS